MKIHPTEDMRVLSIARRLTIPDVGSAAADLSTVIEAERQRAGLAAAGPWTFIAHGLPRDGKTAFDWRICLPVAGTAAYEGPLDILHLEPVMVASAVHLGPLRTLFTQGYAPLLRAIGDTRHHLSGQSREVYHDWRGGKAGYNRIEIQFELSR
ncbi:MAG: hypothetical protein CMN87_16450 [Stappia sp.]|uniref:hypothetical protein n=1 Tax=Stappia sp. TaxID=1870903 RepID=UPI000C389AA1|nr:hypothetical protein [Stappia sp.]MAA98857.1 hypothetical protein [Stappia sp.]MBM21597.1 hypothetical protein [Stappia sp.]|tara:strand:+ start:269 stop:727 length:459 start_codon:yes stop_codon:yes gene_type:complete